MALTFISRRALFRVWLAFIAVFLFLWCHPPTDFRTRLGVALFLGLILIGALVLAWPVRFLRGVLFALVAGTALFLLLPGRTTVDRASLRQAYGDSMCAYGGCPYHWGGEGWFGIDCSGLVRRGMEDALVKRGLLTLNPALVREGIALFWHDTTAKVIGEGYGGRTETVTTCPSLNALDDALVQPGDLAVTASGDHVLAYLGDKKWIAADPIAERVTTFAIPETTNVYFSTPMKIVRWKILAD